MRPFAKGIDDIDRGKARPSWYHRRNLLLALVAAIVLIALAIGLGVGLTQGGSSSSTTPTSTSAPTTTLSGTTLPTPTKTGQLFQPTPSTPWQIVLSEALTNTTPSVPVYDIDLFTNPTSTIANLHTLNRKVICYFSAGTYENFRPDSSSFPAASYKNVVDGWPDERWLDTRRDDVRAIMLKRLDLAQQNGCDGVDPDNVDGYDNDTGFNLTPDDAVSYISFLSNASHTRGLSLGLKNAGEIVQRVLGAVEWSVNEQCVQYSECDVFQPFVQAGKPVFHIEYPPGAGKAVSAAVKKQYCDVPQGFSTLLKDLELDDWYETC